MKVYGFAVLSRTLAFGGAISTFLIQRTFADSFLKPRSGAAAVLLGNNVYVYGGTSTIYHVLENDNFLNLTFSLSAIQTAYPEISQILPSNNSGTQNAPPGYGYVSGVGGPNLQSVCLFGNCNNLSTLDMWCYDTVARKWLHPQFSTLPIVWSNQPVESFRGFFRPQDGQMFLYDGYAQLARYLPTNGSQPWGPWGQVNGASGLVLPIVTRHTFTLTPGGLAVLLGGLQPDYQTLSFQTLYIFDTNALTWSLENATGQIPSSRYAHSTIATPDNRLVVFGGISINQTYEVNQELVAILNCTNWSWAVFMEELGVDATLAAPDGYTLFDHSAVLVAENTMLVMFGTFDFQATVSSPNIYALDLTTLSWLSFYGPNNTDPQILESNMNFTIPNNNNPPSSNLVNISPFIWIVLACIVVSILSCICRCVRNGAGLNNGAATGHNNPPLRSDDVQLQAIAVSTTQLALRQEREVEPPPMYEPPPPKYEPRPPQGEEVDLGVPTESFGATDVSTQTS